MSVIRLLSTLNKRRKPPMSNNSCELTGREKQRIKKLVTSLCANYDKEYGCLPLDCDCPMLGICFTNSALCRYFRKSVLPEDAGLEAVFTQTPTTHCKQCGKPFPTDGKRVYCSQRCAKGFLRAFLHWQGVNTFSIRRKNNEYFNTEVTAYGKKREQ